MAATDAGTSLRHAKSFKELEVYKKARALAREIYLLTKRLPADERFSLTDQIRRYSRSVGAQIAEAWAKRRYPKHFVSKLSDSDAEQMETQHFLGVIADCGYLDKTELAPTRDLCLEIGRMLASMMEKAESFSGAPASNQS